MNCLSLGIERETLLQWVGFTIITAILTWLARHKVWITSLEHRFYSCYFFPTKVVKFLMCGKKWSRCTTKSAIRFLWQAIAWCCVTIVTYPLTAQISPTLGSRDFRQTGHAHRRLKSMASPSTNIAMSFSLIFLLNRELVITCTTEKSCAHPLGSNVPRGEFVLLSGAPIVTLKWSGVADWSFL